MVAWCNATSSAQLAARYPVAGGTYHYGREQLGPWWGFAAGWGFVVGKTASSAAMALTFAAYALPAGWWQRPVAAGALVVLALVNCRGITRTALLTRVLVGVVLAGLTVILVAVVVTAILPEPAGASWSRLGPADAHGGWYGVLQAGGLLFFAFAGYARIATLGEEVRDPARTIPRAIVLALLAAVTLYAVVGLPRTRRPRRGRARRAADTARPGAVRWHVAPATLAPVLVRVGRRHRLARGPAGAHRRHRAHHARDGPDRRSAASTWPPSIRSTRCRTGPSSRPRSWRSWPSLSPTCAR